MAQLGWLLRRGIRLPLLLADVVAWALGWSVFVVFVFGTELALVQFALAPVCLAVAVVVALIERRAGRATRGDAVRLAAS